MRISHLPQEYQELVELRADQQERPLSMDDINATLIWSDTPEGREFWSTCHHVEDIRDLPPIEGAENMEKLEIGDFVYNKREKWNSGDSHEVCLVVGTRPFRVKNYQHSNRRVNRNDFIKADVGVGSEVKILALSSKHQPEKIKGKTFKIKDVNYSDYPDHPISIGHPDAEGVDKGFWFPLNCLQFCPDPDVELSIGAVVRYTNGKYGNDSTNPLYSEREEEGVITSKCNFNGIEKYNVLWGNGYSTYFHASDLDVVQEEGQLTFIPSVLSKFIENFGGAYKVTDAMTNDVCAVKDKVGFKYPIHINDEIMRDINREVNNDGERRRARLNRPMRSRSTSMYGIVYSISSSVIKELSKQFPDFTFKMASITSPHFSEVLSFALTKYNNQMKICYDNNR